MKSEIKIDFVDRGTGIGIEPVIRIELRGSEDPRDTLIAVLFENLRNQSYLQLQYTNHTPVVKEGGHQGYDKRILLFKPEVDTDELMSIVRMAFCEWAIKEGWSAAIENGKGEYIYSRKKETISETDLFSKFISEKANHSA